MPHNHIAAAILAQVASGRRVTADFIEELQELSGESVAKQPKDKSMPPQPHVDSMRNAIEGMIVTGHPLKQALEAAFSKKRKKKNKKLMDQKCACAKLALEKSRVDFDSRRP